jgi:hypothetical protein
MPMQFRALRPGVIAAHVSSWSCLTSNLVPPCCHLRLTERARAEFRKAKAFASILQKQVAREVKLIAVKFEMLKMVLL